MVDLLSGIFVGTEAQVSIVGFFSGIGIICTEAQISTIFFLELA